MEMHRLRRMLERENARRATNTVLKSTLAMIGFVVAVTGLALVYGAMGQSGFNAVTTAAREAR